MSQLIANEFLELLRCPMTGQRLRNASPALLDVLNSLIAAGRVRTEVEDRPEPLDGGLINEAGSHLLAVRGGIVCMCSEDAICLEGLEGLEAVDVRAGWSAAEEPSVHPDPAQNPDPTQNPGPTQNPDHGQNAREADVEETNPS